MLQTEIENAAKTNQYTADAALFKSHTQRLMKELTMNALVTSWSRENVDYPGLVNLMIKLISVHPCTNFNGRSVRMFGFMLGLDFGKGEAPVGFLTDFDLLVQPNTYATMIMQQTAAYHKLRLALLAKAIEAVANKRAPSYFEDKPMWDALVNESLLLLKPPGGAPLDVNGGKDWALIEKRRWVDFLDSKWPQKNWRTR